MPTDKTLEICNGTADIKHTIFPSATMLSFTQGVVIVTPRLALPSSRTPFLAHSRICRMTHPTASAINKQQLGQSMVAISPPAGPLVETLRPTSITFPLAWGGENNNVRRPPVFICPNYHALPLLHRSGKSWGKLFSSIALKFGMGVLCVIVLVTPPSN